MPKDLSEEIKAYDAQFNIGLSSHFNRTVSHTGHNCNLPVYVGYPVSLDPRTGRRADRMLIVRCTQCAALWGVRHVIGIAGPDLIWVEQRPFMTWAKRVFNAHAIDFDASVAYKRPDVSTIDWTRWPRPQKLNGMTWYQIEFPELLGEGDTQCVSTSQIGHGKIGEAPKWTEIRCLLKLEHDGLHESFDSEVGVHGWGVFAEPRI